jgi:sphingomyelin phosphodiesterase
MVPEFVDPIFTTLTEYILNKERMCGEFFGVCDHPKYVTNTVDEYQARVLAYKPAIIQNDDYVNNLYAKIYADPNPRPTLKMVHMSDPHYDDEYAVGTLNKCNSYMCCREYWGYPEDPAL